MSHRNLEQTLQALYDSEINITITTLFDGGFDFALISPMEWEEAGRPIDYMQSFIATEPQRAAGSSEPMAQRRGGVI